MRGGQEEAQEAVVSVRDNIVRLRGRGWSINMYVNLVCLPPYEKQALRSNCELLSLQMEGRNSEECSLVWSGLIWFGLVWFGLIKA